MFEIDTALNFVIKHHFIDLNFVIKHLFLDLNFVINILSLIYYLSKADGDYISYERLGARDSSYYDDYEKDLNTSRILGAVAVATWIFAVVDAYLVAKKESKKYAFEKFNVDTYGKDGVMFRYKTRFSI